MLVELTKQKELLSAKAAQFIFSNVKIIEANGTTKEPSKVSLLYRASQHGWDIKDFHKYC